MASDRMKGFLASLGEGLRAMGSVTSAGNFQEYNRQNQAQQAMNIDKHKLVIGLLAKGAENGSAEATALLKKYTEHLGMGGIDVGVHPAVQQVQLEREKFQKIGQLQDAVAEYERSINEQSSQSPSLAYETSRPLSDEPTTSGAGYHANAGDPNQLQFEKIPPDADPSTAPAQAKNFSGKKDENRVDVDVEPGEAVTASPTVILQNQIESLEQREKAYLDFSKSAAALGANGLAASYRAIAESDQQKRRDIEAALKLSDKEKKIERLVEIGIPKRTAVKIADNVYKVVTDSQGRDYIIDLGTGTRVYGLDPVVIPDKAPKATREALDIEAGTGVSGAFKRTMNAFVGLFGGGLIFRDAEKATNILEQLQTSTILAGSDEIVGRRTDWQLQLRAKLTIDPRKLMKGDAAVLEQMRDLQAFLQDEVARINGLLRYPSAFTQKQVNDMAFSRIKLNDIIETYDWAIGEMERKGKPRKTATEIWNE